MATAAEMAIITTWLFSLEMENAGKLTQKYINNPPHTKKTDYITIDTRIGNRQIKSSLHSIWSPAKYLIYEVIFHQTNKCKGRKQKTPAIFDNLPKLFLLLLIFTLADYSNCC